MYKYHRYFRPFPLYTHTTGPFINLMDSNKKIRDTGKVVDLTRSTIQIKRFFNLLISVMML